MFYNHKKFALILSILIDELHKKNIAKSMALSNERSRDTVTSFKEKSLRQNGGWGEHMTGKNGTILITRSRGYKTFFMLNSAEHDIYPAYKC